ncbi:protein kinase [Bacteroidota bacterium]
MIGKTISHYKIIEKLGSGGMGTVYKAKDTKLDRFVALKFLAPHLSRAEEEKERFIHEAKTTSAMDHPNICNIYDINETEDGQLFIAMACYDGESLKDKINQGPLSIEDALDIAIQIARGLEKAHGKEIVHRDIKPANILITEDKQIKIVDFGLAKLAGQTILTREGSTLGTVAYMSPEQTKGTNIDHRADIWALGLVLYEMLSGERPFKGDYEQAVIYSIMNEEPKPIGDLNLAIPQELQQIVHRALQKKLESRYASVTNMLKDLTAYQDSLRAKEMGTFSPQTLFRKVCKPRIIVPAIGIILLIIFATVWFFNRQAKIRWARETALPEIEQMLEVNDVWRNLVPAYRLAEKVEAILEDDPKLAELFSRVSLNIDVITDPPGASVYVKEYNNPDTLWSFWGVTPLEKVRVPIGVFRWKIEKEGYETILAAASTWDGDILKPDIIIPYKLVRVMDKKDSIPSGMVRVTGAETDIGKSDDFFIDRYEVTNKQYKEFVHEGGYRNREYWKHKFTKNNSELTWGEAIREFVDQSGQPGPSTWQAGDYPEGEENYPVSGVSWYEAAAYAEFIGKKLPTGYHWGIARGEYTPVVMFPQLGGFALIVPFSNFLGKRPVEVGSLKGITTYGAYDMAGNVREWCFNEAPIGRLVRGGAWGDNTYQYDGWSQAPAMDRSAQNGFRCVVYPDTTNIPGIAFEKTSFIGIPYLGEIEEFARMKPVDDAIYQVYKEQFSYDLTDLRTRVESRNESPDWVLEKVSFNAAYGGERMMGWLFIPRNVQSPYQTVIYLGADVPVFQRSSEDIENYYEVPMFFSFLVKNGRAVFYPMYKGFFERGSDELAPIIYFDSKSRQFRDNLIQQVKDLRRSIDYLETRKDIDAQKIGFYGMSNGSVLAPIFLAVEERLKVSVLLAGGLGFGGQGLPEVNQINYITRMKQPTLMLNGKYDSFFPLETSQLRMFELLGTPAEHKELKLYETDHIPPLNETIRETIAWFNKYLGPVN